MTATVTLIKSKQKNGQPPPGESYDFRYQHGVSSVQMPDGTWVCIKQSAAAHATPEQERKFSAVQMAMSLAWAEAWVLENLRGSRMAEIKRTGDYDLAYCPRCQCNRSGDYRDPNPYTEACDDRGCLCHREDLP